MKLGKEGKERKEGKMEAFTSDVVEVEINVYNRRREGWKRATVTREGRNEKRRNTRGGWEEMMC
jgi:hypothetical protein